MARCGAADLTERMFMKQLVIVVVAMVGFCLSGGAHAHASLNGAWRAMEVVVTGGDNPGI